MQGLSLKLKIYPSSEDEEKFFQMSEQYRQACNFISEKYFKSNFTLTKRQLNDKYYYLIRETFGLKAQQAQSVIKTVLARYKSVNTQMSNNPCRIYDKYTKKVFFYYKTLEHLQKPIMFKSLQSDLVYNRDFRFNKNGLVITTLGKLVHVEYDINYFNKYLTKEWKIGTAKLVYKPYNKNWYLHISVTKEIEELENDKIYNIVGIDLGIINTAVTYDDKGKSLFFKGRENREIRKKYINRRSELQSKNTKSSKKRLKSINNRENRWMSDINHKVTKALVDYYGPNTLFVLEDLDSITNDLNYSKNQNQELNSWAFYQFTQFLTYKANLNNSKVIVVDAHYTSQRCPKCGIIHKENRNHDKHSYHCNNCGYNSNDDRIGAMNLYELGKQYVSGVKEPKFRK